METVHICQPGLEDLKTDIDNKYELTDATITRFCDGALAIKATLIALAASAMASSY